MPQGPSPQQSAGCCPKGHELTNVQVRSHRSFFFFCGSQVVRCGECHQQAIGNKEFRYCCTDCDYHLCAKCSKRDVAAATSAAKPATSLPLQADGAAGKGAGGKRGVELDHVWANGGDLVMNASPASAPDTMETATPSSACGEDVGLRTSASEQRLSRPGPATPRVAAANFDFGLQIDQSAQERWARFAEEEEGPAASDAAAEAELRLRGVARAAAARLRFLELTVASPEQLEAESSTWWSPALPAISSRRKGGCLECYSPFAGVPPRGKAELMDAALALREAERAMGALVGLAVADALGAPFEFLDATDVEDRRHRFDLAKFKSVGARNKFRVKPGQWTDDTSMGLCLADSLLARGRYDGSDARVRYHNWWFRGYNNAFGNDSRIGSVGLGNNVAKSLRAMRPNKVPPPTYKATTEDAGNGTLMRLASVPIFYCHDPLWAARASAASSLATHPGPIAAAACSFFGFAIARAVGRKDADVNPKAFLDGAVEAFLESGLPEVRCPELARLLQSREPKGGKEECWNWRSPRLEVERSLAARGSSYNGYPCSQNYFGSYCIDGLAVALWSFYNTTSFMEAVVRAVNFLGDADTNAAICGQLAGAFYGYDAIDHRLLSLLDVWDDGDVACRAALLYASRPRDLGPLGGEGPCGWACPAAARALP